MRLWRYMGLIGSVLGMSASCGGRTDEGENGALSSGTAETRAESTDGAPPSATLPRSADTMSPPTVNPPPPREVSEDVPPAPPRVPKNHRALSMTCDDERPPGNARPYDMIPCSTNDDCTRPDYCSGCNVACVEYPEGKLCAVRGGDCLSDADCTGGENGRCFDNRGHWFCTYDACFSDGECMTGGPCACEGQSGSPGNTCLPGNCQTDADCGSGGYCSPTFGGCGNYSGVIAYYCHTPEDTCIDDADCVSEDQGPGYCMYSPEVGHWTCGYGQCVG